MRALGLLVAGAALLLAPAIPATADNAPPTPQSHWDFADGDTFPIQVRDEANMIDFPGKYVTVDVTIDGKAGTFLLDTGAGMVLISSDFARALKLESTGSARYIGVAGAVQNSNHVLIKDMGFGRSTLHDVTATVATTDIARHLDGIIGYPVFAGAIVDVLLTSKQMAVYDPAKFAPTIGPKSYVFDVDLSSHQPQVAGSVNDKVAIHPIFDTGDDFLLTLSHQLRDDGKIVTLPGTVLSLNGVDGSSDPVGCSRVTRVAFGALRYNGPLVCFQHDSWFGADGGIVGMDFLGHFDWTIDYPDKKFVLTPNGL